MLEDVNGLRCLNSRREFSSSSAHPGTRTKENDHACLTKFRYSVAGNKLSGSSSVSDSSADCSVL